MTDMEIHFRKHARISRAALTLLAVSAVAGCRRSPTFNILGSFFPAWLLCMVAGIILAAIAGWLLARFKLEKLIVWPVLVYPALAGFFAFTLWLVFFS